MAIERIGSGLESQLLGELQPRSGGERFAARLAEHLQDVNTDQVEAARKVKEFVVDGEGSIHDAMMAVTKAEGSFRLLMEMRNRLIEATNRLLQMPI